MADSTDRPTNGRVKIHRYFEAVIKMGASDLHLEADSSARELVRSSLVFNLRAIVCLKLLEGLHPDIPRIPAVEVMIANPAIRKLIGDKREREMVSVIRNSSAEGMADFTASLLQLVDKELISTQTAYQAAPNPDELRMRLKGISVTGGGIIG